MKRKRRKMLETHNKKSTGLVQGSITMFLIAYLLIGIVSMFGAVLLMFIIDKSYGKISNKVLFLSIKKNSYKEGLRVKRMHIFFPFHHEIKYKLTVMKEGKVPLMVYRMETGKADIYYQNKKIGELKAKDIFGSHEVYKNKPSSYEVKIQPGSSIDAIGKSLLTIHYQGVTSGKSNRHNYH